MLLVLGDGFEYIDTERMRDEKVLYSLTRHGVNKTENGKCSTLNMCLDVPYQGTAIPIHYNILYL